MMNILQNIANQDNHIDYIQAHTELDIQFYVKFASFQFDDSVKIIFSRLKR